MWAAGLGMLISSAAAFAMPLPSAAPAASGDPVVQSDAWWTQAGAAIARTSAGDTLLVDARLGHPALAAGAAGETFLFASVKGAPDGAAAGRVAPPIELTLVIDRSGSMKGERIANAKAAALLALERLRPGDRVSVVAFDQTAELVVPTSTLDDVAKADVRARIRGIRLGGDTCLSCGLELAEREIARGGALARGAGDETVRRVLVLSDGAANVGAKDAPGLRALAARLRGLGATVSTIGVDVEFDERTLAAIASEGNGRHHFVAEPGGLPAIFAAEFDEVTASVAKDTELALELEPGVEVDQVFDRTFRREGRRLLVPLGAFAAGQEKTLLVKLRVPTDAAGTKPVARVGLAFRDLVKKKDASCEGTLALRVLPEGERGPDLDPFVSARVERSKTASALEEANALFTAGRLADAKAKVSEQRARVAARRAEAEPLALATPAPKSSTRSLGDDFARQDEALAQAERGFAPAAEAPLAAATAAAGPLGHAAGAGRFAPAPPPAARPEPAKRAVKQNQANAFDLAF